MGLGRDPIELQGKLGYTFNDPRLLTEAITHSSYANEHKPTPSSERLEFLGDAVLELAVSRYLYHSHPEYSEGDLTRLRQQLVCEETLAGLARVLSLGEYLSVGKGEELAGSRFRPSILADALEALIAAVDLDSQGAATEALVQRIFGDTLRFSAQSSSLDYKTRLQQLVQQDGNEELRYEILAVSGPEHDKLFEVQAYINSNPVGRGTGRSRRDAEQSAAREALLLFGVRL